MKETFFTFIYHFDVNMLIKQYLMLIFFLGARIILNMGTRRRSSGLGRKRRYIKVTFGQQWSITNGLNVSGVYEWHGLKPLLQWSNEGQKRASSFDGKIQKRVIGRNIPCGLFTPRGFSTFSYTFKYIIVTASKKLPHR